MSASVRVWLTGLLALAVWLLTAWTNEPHRTAPVSISPLQFSSARAEQILEHLLGSERPHPVSSDENAVVRSRLLEEFARLGVHAQTYHAFACDVRRTFALISCATVNDVIANVLPGEGEGKAVL